MKVTVRLFGDLRRCLPKGEDRPTLELPEGSTATTIYRKLGIHPGEVWMVRANRKVIQDDRPLEEGDELEIFEPIGGGC